MKRTKLFSFFTISLNLMLLFPINAYAMPDSKSIYTPYPLEYPSKYPENLYYMIEYDRYSESHHTFDGNGHILYTEHFNKNDELSSKTYYQYDNSDNLTLATHFTLDKTQNNFVLYSSRQYEYSDNLLIQYTKSVYSDPHGILYQTPYRVDITIYQYNDKRQLINKIACSDYDYSYEYLEHCNDITNIYNEAGHLIYQSGHYYQYEFDTAGNCIKRIHSTSDSIQSISAYAYNNSNNLIEKTTYNVEENYYNTTTYEYEYDEADRIVEYDTSTESYYFDENGEKHRYGKGYDYNWKEYYYEPYVEENEDDWDDDYSWAECY